MITSTTRFKKFSFMTAKVVSATSLVAFSFSVNAGTATSNLSATATATVAANCTISSSAVAFGVYDPMVANKTANLDATGTVTVTCTNGSTGTITLGQGVNPATGSTASIPLRQMAASTDRLSYDLYSDTARSVVWADTSATGVARNCTGAADAVTVYVRVPANQNVPAGSYVDTVVATVTF